MNRNAKPEVFATGFISPEGPSFNRQGDLFIMDWDAGIYRLTQEPGLAPDQRVTEFMTTGGMPTGSKFHRNGDLYVCDSGRNEVLTISPDGEMEVAAAAWEGRRFQGPNDLAFAANGDLYFTDPKGSDPDNPIGSVYLLRADGRVERFATGFAFPNGIILSEDDRTLFLAETFPNRIHAFDLDEEGRARAQRTFIQLEGGFGPDGMAFDVEDNLYVAHFGKGVVAVIDPEGTLVAELPAGGEKPTNVAFWGETLFVTDVDKSQVVCLDVGVAGRTVFGLS